MTILIHTYDYVPSLDPSLFYFGARQQCLFLRKLDTLLLKYNYPLIAFCYSVSQRRMQHPNNSNLLFIEWNDHRHIIQVIQKWWFQNPFQQSSKPIYDLMRFHYTDWLIELVFWCFAIHILGSIITFVQQIRIITFVQQIRMVLVTAQHLEVTSFDFSQATQCIPVTSRSPNCW